jgi:hypothetical protein
VRRWARLFVFEREVGSEEFLGIGLAYVGDWNSCIRCGGWMEGLLCTDCEHEAA